MRELFVSLLSLSYFLCRSFLFLYHCPLVSTATHIVFSSSLRCCFFFCFVVSFFLLFFPFFFFSFCFSLFLFLLAYVHFHAFHTTRFRTRATQLNEFFKLLSCAVAPATISYHRLGGARCTPLVLTTSGSAVRTKVRISFSAPLSTRVLVASISLFPAFSFSASTHKSVRAHLAETQRLNNLIITVATWLTLNLHTVSHSQFIVETTEIIIVISVFLTVNSVICISSGIVVATAATATAAAATPLVITPAIKQIYRQTRFHHAVLLSCVTNMNYPGIYFILTLHRRVDVSSLCSTPAQCVYDARTVHASGTRDPTRHQKKEIG